MFNMHPECQCEFTLQCLGWPEPLTRLAKHSECEFTLQCLSRSEPLTRLTEHIQSVSLLSSVLADQNHWWDWLNMDPACESFFSIWANQNYWCKWLNMHPGCELLFSVWAENHWWKWLNMYSGSEFSLKSESLRRMVKHISSGWVHSLVFEQIRTTDKNGWTHISREWVHSPVF